MDCPLCSDPESLHYHSDQRRGYRQCPRCRLVFVPAEYHLDSAAERAEYELHDNNPVDPGYRRFLSRLSEPLVNRLQPGMRGLDFGCGPGPALAMMLQEQGLSMSLYDPFFSPDRSVLDRRYDFITATEVVEHLRRPGEELEMLWSMLRPGGVLGVMTKLVLDVEAFSRWHYKNDPTHVCFFSAATWEWWAQRRDARLELLGSDVILLTRAR